MPSASAKVEKVAALEATDPVKLCVQMVEKRIRNLEKRKLKLDNYRSDVKNGKELNEDQKIAVSKYDSVLSLLEFAGDLSKSMQGIFVESSRQQKKQAKKEQLERQQYEIQRLQEAFIYRHILSCFQTEDVRNDFLNGENGAVQLTSEQLSQLDQLYKLIGPELPNEQADLTNHFHVLAENYIFLVEGRNKEIAGTTYKVLKDLLHSIKESGYFSRPSETLEDGSSSDDMPEEELLPEKLENDKIEIEEPPTAESPDEHFEASEDSKEPAVVALEEVVPEVQPTVQNGPLQDVLAPQSTFNFLQESQIDLGAPHMDPAVVAVHQIAPPPVVNYAMNPYPTSPPHEEASPPLVNGNEPHEVSPPINQVPVLPNPRSVAPVLTSVQHDFDPSHPIPTQTFTNQSFAVMQNMIMPQAYVPVTMHHGPLPPHIAPIAVVPASPATSAPAPAIPMHVPIAPVSVPLQDAASPVAVESKPELEEAQLPTIENNGSDADPSSSDSPAEKGNEGNGYHQYRGGYRGRGRGRGNNGYFRGRNNYHNGRGGYQNHYYQDRNGYNGNYRRGNNRGGPRGNGNNRGGRGNYRMQSQQQPSQAPQQQQQTQQ